MKVNIQRISEGIHEISEVISTEDLRPSPEFKVTNQILISGAVDRFEDSFRVKLNIKADLLEQCDRCLTEYKSHFEESGEQIYQLGKGEYEDDDIEVLPENTKELDLSKLINEVFLINRPIQKTCKEDCRGLCPDCGVNLNDSTCNCKNERIDPRLEKLKSLIK